MGIAQRICNPPSTDRTKYNAMKAALTVSIILNIVLLVIVFKDGEKLQLRGSTNAHEGNTSLNSKHSVDNSGPLTKQDHTNEIETDSDNNDDYYDDTVDDTDDDEYDYDDMKDENDDYYDDDSIDDDGGNDDDGDDGDDEEEEEDNDDKEEEEEEEDDDDRRS